MACWRDWPNDGASSCTTFPADSGQDYVQGTGRISVAMAGALPYNQAGSAACLRLPAAKPRSGTYPKNCDN